MFELAEKMIFLWESWERDSNFRAKYSFERMIQDDIEEWQNWELRQSLTGLRGIHVVDY